VDATLTRTGELKGKLPFIAPELFEGGAASPSSDIFALGVSFYWLLTGRRPFTRPTEGATILAILTDAAAPPSVCSTDVPRALDDLVLAMLAKPPARRPPAEAVVSALEPFIADGRAALATLVGKHARLFGSRAG
jgi:serine/threonine protein kinase